RDLFGAPDADPVAPPDPLAFLVVDVPARVVAALERGPGDPALRVVADRVVALDLHHGAPWRFVRPRIGPGGPMPVVPVRPGQSGRSYTSSPSTIERSTCVSKKPAGSISRRLSESTIRSAYLPG